MKADIDVRLIQEAIRGRPIDEAADYLSTTLPLETEPALRVHPTWMKRVPWMPFRIMVVETENAEEMARALPSP